MADSVASEQASSRRVIPLRRKLVFALVIWVFVLGVPELMLRLLWHPAPRTPAVGTRQFVNWLSRLSEDERDPQPLYRTDSRLLWRLEPGVQIASFNHHFAPNGETQPIQISINEEGYRGSKVSQAKKSSVSRILCLGDSNFFGYPLDDADTFPSVLEKTLRARAPERKWEVTNGGVPGYTVVQGWRWYQEAFQDHHFDFLLLSFLNNDAWRQPGQDLDLLSQKASPLQPLGDFARQSRLVSWVEACIRPAIPKDRYVPRVSKDDFISHYRLLIDAARKAGTRVVILDYRAYAQYEPYSQALRVLAADTGVEYLLVGERIAGAMSDAKIISRYPLQADRIQRRWGTELLSQRPYLWYFAEYHPEHLNELGVAWLTDQLKEIFVPE